MQSVDAWPSKGCDSAGDDHFPGYVCTPEWLASIPEITFIARYTRPDGKVLDKPKPGGDWAGCYSISKLELEWIMNANKAFVPLQFGNSSHDDLDADLGYRRGEAYIKAVTALGLPLATHLFLNVEGASCVNAGRDNTYNYINAASEIIVGCAELFGTYFGDSDVPLSSEDMYNLPLVTAYYGAKGCRKYKDPQPRGWSILQGLPTTLNGLSIDPDEMVIDGKGLFPRWVIA